MIDRDADGSGVLRGPMHNTLDADWYGVVPWLVGLYHAALRAGEAMAEEIGDPAFARLCRTRLEKGIVNLDKLTWREEKGYYVHLGDPKHLSEVGSYDGCEIDQVFGQSWAWQVGLGRRDGRGPHASGPALALALQRDSRRRPVPQGQPGGPLVCDAGRRRPSDGHVPIRTAAASLRPGAHGRRCISTNA